MKITLNNFEDYIDPKIVKRGKEYFEGNFVGSLTIKGNSYTAEVMGSENYEIEIQLKNKEIVSHLCDCPFEHGEFCKHEVAVLYYINENNTIETEEKSITKLSTKTTQSKTTKNKGVSGILEKISHQELKDFVLNLSVQDKKFKENIERKFAEISGDNSISFYRKHIKSIFNSGKERGFIDYYQMRKVGKELLLFLDEAKPYVEEQKNQTVVNMILPLLEETVLATQFCDDSDGYITAITEGCFDCLTTIAISDLDEELRKYLFQYCINVFDKKIFSGWDWHSSILILASKMIKNKIEVETILNRLQLASSKQDSYEQEIFQSLKYDILLKWKSKYEAEQFLYDNINNYKLRIKAISLAINNFELDKAKVFCKEGIDFNKNEKPGLVKIWYNWLLKIAELENDQFNIVLYAKYLLIDNFHPERDYYQILKDNTSKQDWEIFVDDLVIDILKYPKNHGKHELVAKIYILEERWESLWNLVKQFESIYFLETYEKYLTATYQKEIIDFYIHIIKINITTASSRTEYARVCKYLKKVKKMGANNEVEILVQNFKDQYPKKKALIDELNKV